MTGCPVRLLSTAEKINAIDWRFASTLVSIGSPPSSQRTNFSISLGTEFASGDYGTNTTTESVYVPLIVTWFPTERIDIGIEVPYIYQNNSNVTTTIYQGNQTTTVAKVVSKLGGPGGSKANVGTTAVSGSSASAASSSR